MAASATTFTICRDDGAGPTLPELLALPRLLRTMLRNLIEAWPEAIYAEPLVETRFLGRRTTYVTDPALIRSLLVDQAGALAREDFMIRALGPALGTGVLTADGEPWRAQRRKAAPVFRPDRIRGFVPAMAGAARATWERWRARPVDARPLDLLPEMMRVTARHAA